MEIPFQHKGQIFLGVRKTLSDHVQKVSFQFNNLLIAELVFPALHLKVPSKSAWRQEINSVLLFRLVLFPT